MKRRIAFFLPDFGGGGAERVQLAIIRHLLAKGHEIDLILAFEGGVLLPLLPPEVRVIELRARRLIGSFPGLVRYLKAERPWSLQAIMWPCTVIAAAARMVARSSTRLLLSEHSTLSRQYPGPRKRLALQATIRLFYPRADRVISVSKGAAADVERLAGMPPGSVEVVYNPMDLPSPLPDAALAGPKWLGACPRLIAVGRLTAEKNHDLLLRAFALLLGSHPDAALIILGEGELRPRLEERRRQLGLDRKVHLPGFVLDPWQLLVSADLFVLSSDFEGMSLVLIEAMHAGLRVVSTDCQAGPAELLDGERYGRLAPVGDAEGLARAMREELAAPRNPERQRARAREVTGLANLERYETLLTR